MGSICQSLRLSGVVRENALELQDMDSGTPCRQCLYRLNKIWSGNFFEFGLRSRIDLYPKKENRHRRFPHALTSAPYIFHVTSVAVQ